MQEVLSSAQHSTAAANVRKERVIGELNITRGSKNMVKNQRPSLPARLPMI
jgi:hypothetical protein